MQNKIWYAPSHPGNKRKTELGLQAGTECQCQG